MAYTQSPGRSPFKKTGRDIPLNFLSPLHSEGDHKHPHDTIKPPSGANISEADIMNDPAFIKPGGDNIGVDSAGMKLNQKDINTGKQLDAIQAAATGKGSKESFKIARNMKDTNVQSGSFSVTGNKGVRFRTKDHINGKSAGNTYIFDKSGNISHSQGKNIAINPYLTNKLGYKKSN
jgi:hypothetical protein